MKITIYTLKTPLDSDLSSALTKIEISHHFVGLVGADSFFAHFFAHSAEHLESEAWTPKGGIHPSLLQMISYSKLGSVLLFRLSWMQSIGMSHQNDSRSFPECRRAGDHLLIFNFRLITDAIGLGGGDFQACSEFLTFAATFQCLKHRKILLTSKQFLRLPSSNMHQTLCPLTCPVSYS